MRILATSVWATLVLCAANHADAQTLDQVQQLKLLTIEELAETDITGSGRRSEQLEEVAAAVSVITSDDLRRYGATSLPQALRLAETLHVARTGGASWAISPRGFNITSANKMLVMIDGRTVYSPVFAGVFWDAQEVFIDDVDRIEVVRGPGGTLWGANAVNGVIHVVTKNAADTRGTYVTAAAGDESMGPFGMRHGGRFGQAGSYRAYLQVRGQASTQFLDGGDAHNDHRTAQSGFRIESDRSAASFAVLQGDVFNARTGLPGELETQWTGGNLLGRWTRRAAASETTVQAYYDYFYRRTPLFYRGVLHTIDFDAQHERTYGAHVLVVGAGYRRYRGDDLGDGPGFIFEPRVRVSNRSNVFAQAQFNVRRELFVTVGAKLEHNEFTGVEVQPSAAVRWTRAAQTLWGSVAKAVRVPTRLDTDFRLLDPGTGAVTLTGSADFASETVAAYEVGYRIRVRARMSLDISAYDNRYDELRSQERPPPGQPIRLANMLNATARGVEITSKAQLLPRWQLSGGYTRLWKRFSLDPASTDVLRGAAEANDPRHIINLRSYVDAGDRLEIDAFYRHVGALPGPPVDAYSELDARVGYRVRPGWDVSLIGTSLISPRHMEFRGNAAPQGVKRAFSLRSTWRF